ncbi:MAG: PAS domain S-box protein [Candidatus Hydrogenedentes bacterium]|nr:PAS domain S-box protein [Candidatus Hydrogenedentota bacterium]
MATITPQVQPVARFETYDGVLEHALKGALAPLTIFGTLALVTGVSVEYSHGNYGTAALYFLVYCGAAFFALNSRLGYRLRISLLLSVLYLLAVSELVEYGVGSLADMLFLTILTLASVFFSRSAGYTILALIVVTIFTVGLLYLTGQIEIWNSAQFGSTEVMNWLSGPITFLVMCVLILLVLGVVVSTLRANMLESAALVRDLQAQIEERVRAEEALRESEERSRTMMECVFEGIAISESGRLLDTNSAFLDIFGYSREEMKGMSAVELAVPEDRETVENAIRSGREDPYEIRMVRKDGTIIDLEVHGTQLMFGGRQCRGTAVRDVTAYKRAQEALQASEERFRLVFEYAPDACFICDPDCVLQFGNRAAERLLGWKQDELAGKSYLDLELVHPDDLPKALEAILANRQGEETGPNEFRVRRKDGSYVFTEIRAYPLLDREQPMILHIARDITERKRAETERVDMQRRLEQTQRLESLGVLAGGIAHDFNNLLLVVLGHADMALTDVPSTSPARENLSQIMQTAKRAAELCRQMLAYSGRGKFVVEALNVDHLISELLHLLQASISKKSVLKLDLVKDLPPMRGDASQLRQILMNLVINASEAIGEDDGVISIATGVAKCSREYLANALADDDLPEGEYVYFEVADTGCGMNQETLGRIFEPFYTTKFTGRGLGLSAVLGIVRGHKGALVASSEPGNGSAFRVLFPADLSAQRAATPAWPDSEPQWKGAGRVLLVDDEETIRSMTGKMLERIGFDVITAYDGSEAIRLFREHCSEIDFVLLDLTMPRMNGEETFRELRSIDAGVRVVLSSGYTENEIEARFAGKGLAGFIQKPYTLATLRNILRASIHPEPMASEVYPANLA